MSTLIHESRITFTACYPSGRITGKPDVRCCLQAITLRTDEGCNSTGWWRNIPGFRLHLAPCTAPEAKKDTIAG